MTREKSRSRRYKSFLTCDTPKSVEVERSAIIKSNSSQKKEQQSHKVIVEVDKKKQENKTTTLAIRGLTRELDTFQQLQQVSNGNHVTNSCSNNVGNEDIAKDFLKGVFDLRESLAILSKLQAKRRHKLKHEALHMGFDGSRASVDGSSRKSFDGVKDVVRASLLRQNVSYKSRVHKDFSDRKKGKGSNLIVKLMGLESLPSSPRNFVKQEKVMSLGGKQRAFDEILESLNFKGVLRSNSNSRNFEDYPLFDERPPIVVMRPLRSHSFARNEGRSHDIRDTENSNQKDRDFYSKNQISSSISDYRIVKSSDSFRQQKKKRHSVSMNERRKGRVMGSQSGYIVEIDSNSEDEYTLPTFDSMLISNRRSRAMTIPDYDAESHTYFSATRESIEYFNNNSKDSDRISLASMPENDSQSLHSEITSTSISSDHSPLSETEITVPLNINKPENANISESYKPCEECQTPRAKLKAFLSSSPSFLNRAEELFNLEVNPSLIPNISDLDFPNPKVLVDYAIEVMEVRSYQHSQVFLPRFFTTCSRNYPSLGEILEDICKGIEHFIGYVNPGFSSDNLYAKLDRDLRFKSGVWEVGWRNAFSMDEVEEIVGEVDKIVIGNLIEELLVDFLL